MTDDLQTREVRAARLKERIYVTFVALAVVLALRAQDADAGKAIATLAVTVLGTLLAVFVADFTSHFVVHERGLTRGELRVALLSSFGALTSLVLPFVFLLLALLGVWTTDGALLASNIALLVSLVVSGWVAVRKLRLSWWQRLFALGGEALLGLAVVGLQVLAHG